jgi:hypothetical protein
MGYFVIVTYRPRSENKELLQAMLKEHWPLLEKEGLVTQRAPEYMSSIEGEIIEIFEWKSSDSILHANKNPAVQAFWTKLKEIADFVPLSSVSEAQDTYANFTTLNFRK